MMEDAPTQDTPPNVSTPSQGDPELEEPPVTAIAEKQLEKKRRTKKNLYKQSAKDLKEDFLYDQIAETRRATIGDGYVEFTKHFTYLGTNVSYNLNDDYDISQRITNTFQSMWVH